MTKYDLLDVLGSLDEKYLQEAEQRAKEHADFEEDDYLENIEIAKNEKPRRFPVYFGMTIAAGLALVVGATCFFANRSNNGLTEPAASVVTVPMNEISSPDSSGSTVPTIVTEVTETTTLAVTTTVTKANENSMPDMLVPTQTQDPSLITTDPNDHVTYNGLNIFGGVGNVEIECGGDVLVFADQKNMYVSDSRMIYPKNPADLSVHGGTMNGRLMENYGLNPRQTFISDGESLFAYDVDVMSGSISRLSLDASEWETFSALPFEHAEFMMIDSISRYQGGYLFIFSNCMNLNVAANQSAYLYDPDTKEWTPIITGEDGFGSFHITAGTMNESHVPESLKLTVCRPVDTSDQTKREFAF
ncbi:MAG: hypothetical protein J6P20_10065, partial [Oscillospiraceae bacterium]|nr:hypothetical protein [Oscillospiraceae bacterium]